jgi:hypothetical protein
MNYRKRLVLIFSIAFIAGLSTKAYTQTVSYADTINRIAFAVEDKLTGNTPVAIIKFDSSSERFSNRIINDLMETLGNL